jgi:hypothetical protein
LPSTYLEATARTALCERDPGATGCDAESLQQAAVVLLDEEDVGRAAEAFIDAADPNLPIDRVSGVLRQALDAYHACMEEVDEYSIRSMDCRDLGARAAVRLAPLLLRRVMYGDEAGLPDIEPGAELDDLLNLIRSAYDIDLGFGFDIEVESSLPALGAVLGAGRICHGDRHTLEAAGLRVTFEPRESASVEETPSIPSGGLAALLDHWRWILLDDPQLACAVLTNECPAQDGGVTDDTPYCGVVEFRRLVAGCGTGESAGVALDVGTLEAEEAHDVHLENALDSGLFAAHWYRLSQEPAPEPALVQEDADILLKSLADAGGECPDELRSMIRRFEEVYAPPGEEPP